jgi:8-oxo-dGTP pyrophosphatase MutT (NUDIX family)
MIGQLAWLAALRHAQFRQLFVGQVVANFWRLRNGPDYTGAWARTPPSGARLPGAPVEDCARRELREETGAMCMDGADPPAVKFYPQFDHIVLLSAPAHVLVERVTTRTNNPYGKKPDELAETLRLLQTVEPLLRGSATLEIDTSTPLEHVITAILDHALP